MSTNTRTTIVLNNGFRIDVEMEAAEVVRSFIACNDGKPIDAGRWWTPWSNCSIRLDQVVAICPRNPAEGKS
jgi:hypothetical protein